MSLEKKFFFNDIGEVVIRKRRNVRRLSIRINRTGDVSMTIPYVVSYRDALRFFEEKREWVVKTLHKVKEATPPVRLFGEGEIMATAHHRILVEKKGDETPRYRVNGDTTIVKLPASTDISSGEIQDFIKEAIIETLRHEARQVLIPRAREMAATRGFEVKRIYVKNLRSRWGSCSSLNNINLNIHLMRLPGHLVDYVILHELVHTIHHNHSADFWNELARHIDSPKSLAKELRKYHTAIDGIR